jgi:hypothetical protein
VNRIHTYNLDHPQKQKELDTVKQIVLNNKYNTSLLNRDHNSKKHKQKLEEDKKTQSG